MTIELREVVHDEPGSALRHVSTGHIVQSDDFRWWRGRDRGGTYHYPTGTQIQVLESDSDPETPGQPPSKDTIHVRRFNANVELAGPDEINPGWIDDTKGLRFPYRGIVVQVVSRPATAQELRRARGESEPVPPRRRWLPGRRRR